MNCPPLSRFCTFLCINWFFACIAAAGQSQLLAPSLAGGVGPRHGSYTLITADGAASLRHAAVAAEVDHRWLRAEDYPKPDITKQDVMGELGAAHQWTVTYSGAPGKPDLLYRLRVYARGPFADLQVTVRNSTQRAIAVQDIRPVELSTANGIQLGGPEADDRVLSDSFSEDRPAMKIRDLGNADHSMHRGVGSQLIYNRKSRESLFVGALTSDKFLSILRIHVAGQGAQAGIGSYEVDSAGTTELTKQYSLLQAPPEDQMELSVRVAPGHEISSERLLMSLGDDYHGQLRTYGELIRDLHHARVSAPTPMGWWSWTAYYAGLDRQEALANAEWLAKNLKDLGYNFFHIDEGYSIARGDYLTPNAKLFPDGAEKVEQRAAALGLVPGIWTAPFEVSERSWVYMNHPEWLVHNADGKPILLAGSVMPSHERIYVLDATHPGAQEYLRKTYSTMTRQWGVRYIKLDFMEDTCIEGERHRAGASALEAQRVGLQVIRKAVGDGVYLDKDGSVMLNPVGIVDMGRISQDTAHHFSAIKDAATGIAARYYMNRNFFISDPDAFMVTKGEGENQFSLSEAKVSIALSAISGGMLEIGNDLPSLSSQLERLALIENKDLIAMARLGKASVPVDLMSYQPEDGQPSVFYLRESARQGIFTVFNWTDGDRTHGIDAATLGLNANQTYKVQDIWDGRVLETCHPCVFNLKLEPHSVQMLKVTGMEPSPTTRE